MKNLSLLPVFGLLAGCATSNLTLQHDMAKVQPLNVKVEANDAKPIFKKAIPSFGFWKKGDLETEGEYRTRLIATGVEGREITAIIDPKVIEFMAFPDQGFYIIHTRDSFSPYRSQLGGTDEKADCITIAEDVRKGRTVPMSNAFGVTVDVTTFGGERYMLKLSNLATIPTSMKWRKDDKSSFWNFGLPVRIADPAFREKLKNNRITLAIRGQIGSPAEARETFDGYSATIDSPISASYEVYILPFTITEAFVVDLDTGMSVVGIKL